ncbi:MAG: hypothetical protein R3C28_29925 [Pirellulaceae bacterium]
MLRTPAFFVLLLGIALSLLWLRRGPDPGTEPPFESKISLRQTAPPRVEISEAAFPREFAIKKSETTDPASDSLNHRDFGSHRIKVPQPNRVDSRIATQTDVEDKSPAQTAPPTARLVSVTAGRWVRHTIRDGDTLELIAQIYLNTPQKSDEVFNSNRDVLTDTQTLPIGSVLRIYIHPK